MAVDRDFEQTMYRHTEAAPLEDDLFTTFADRVLRRVDEVIDGRFCQWPPQELDRRFLRLLRPHLGKDRAVPLGLFCEQLDLTPRALKNLVQILRLDFGVQIGASRESDAGGYYLISTEAESVESTDQLWKQAITMLRVVRAGAFTPATYTIFGWETPNIEAAIDDLTPSGLTFERFPFFEQDPRAIWHAPNGAKVAWFKDPDGNTLSLSQHPA